MRHLNKIITHFGVFRIEKRKKSNRSIGEKRNRINIMKDCINNMSMSNNNRKEKNS